MDLTKIYYGPNTLTALLNLNETNVRTIFKAKLINYTVFLKEIIKTDENFINFDKYRIQKYIC